MLSATVSHFHDRYQGAAERGQHGRDVPAGNERVETRGLAGIGFTPVLVQLRVHKVAHEHVEARLNGLDEHAAEESEVHQPLTPIIASVLGFGTAAPAAAAISNAVIAAGEDALIVMAGAVSSSLCSPRSAQFGDDWLPKFIELVYPEPTVVLRVVPIATAKAAVTLSEEASAAIEAATDVAPAVDPTAT
jgi:hypothetical protein